MIHILAAELCTKYWLVLALPDTNGAPEESLLQMELILPDPNRTPEESLLQMELILVLLPLGKLVALLRPE
jgi:hypothetical protein